MKKPSFLILIAAVIALAAKVYCAGTTIGTNDVALFRMFGQEISRHGLIELYQATRLFNHTPLVGSYSSAIFRVAGDDVVLFALLLRLPGILADFGTVMLLLRWRARTGTPAWWALALFALSPVLFMVSGYHGNVDSVMVFLLCAAAFACAEGRVLLSALALGLACNVKVVPILVAPVFVFYWFQRGNGWAFVGMAAATIIGGWSFPLVMSPALFLRNVLGYGSYWGTWGITYWLRQTPLLALQLPPGSFINLPPLATAIAAGLKMIIISSALWLGWLGRKKAPTEIVRTLALVFTVFFVFAPGVGGQYLVWIAPFLLLSSARGFAVYTGAASIALFVFYNVISQGLPWDFGVSTNKLAPHWLPWMTLPWLAFVIILAASWKAFLPASKVVSRQREGAVAVLVTAPQ